MKQGRTLQELAQEVNRQQKSKHDYLVDARNMTMMINDDSPVMAIADITAPFGITNIAHGQVSTYTGVPKRYYDKMLVECPDLLASNVNTWLHRSTDTRMFRSLDNRLRALLSNSYRALDNFQLLEAALPPLQEMGVEIVSCDVTESKLYLKVVDKRIKRDLKTGVKLGVGHDRFDTLSPALVISNSEVGEGALAVSTSVWTHGCTNLMVISERSQRKYHLGSRADIGEEVYRLLSDDTRRITDQAMWSQVRDLVGAAFQQAQFDAVCDKLEETTAREIGDPIKTIEVVAKQYELVDNERVSILNHLIRGGDLSQYGLHAAITRTAEDLADYDRASEFERIGGKLVELPSNEWDRLYGKAA